MLQEIVSAKGNGFETINIYFQYESRFRLFTRIGKWLTAKGVKPIGSYHHKYESIYLFGAFSPITGAAFMLYLPFCNAATFQVFLDEFAI